ncbi:hypothetical protein LTR53_003557 [Teratosphaeriaceae sp. CCFEE 6253]|nr:hypothetical protein LTR53_003557 [Teratosphaeriaceae sp. CCFEE 6253]
MSARNRARGASNQDADEERRLWKEIVDRSKEVDVMVARSNAIGEEIIELETHICALIDAGSSTAAADEKLEKLYRENVKICEEVQHTFEGQSNSPNLLDSINILAGLRGASEESLAASQASQSQRAASGKLARGPKKNAKNGTATPAIVTTEDHPSHDDLSAAPSPRIHLSTAASRLGAGKEGKAATSSRANSVAATREPSVKIEQDGAESVASSTDAPSVSTTHNTHPPGSNTGKNSASSLSNAGGRPTNRLVLRLGEIVFCRHDFKSAAAAAATIAAASKLGAGGAEMPEGEGILCRVTNVIGDGKQRRYEVQDADTSGDPLPPPQRASVSQLIQIPESNKGYMVELPKGKGVLAQYPDTTTFYKAEVSEAWKGVKRGGAGAEGESPGMVRLNFQDDEMVRENMSRSHQTSPRSQNHTPGPKTDPDSSPTQMSDCLGAAGPMAQADGGTSETPGVWRRFIDSLVAAVDDVAITSPGGSPGPEKSAPMDLALGTTADSDGERSEEHAGLFGALVDCLDAMSIASPGSLPQDAGGGASSGAGVSPLQLPLTVRDREDVVDRGAVERRDGGLVRHNSEDKTRSARMDSAITGLDETLSGLASPTAGGEVGPESSPTAGHEGEELFDDGEEDSGLHDTLLASDHLVLVATSSGSLSRYDSSRSGRAISPLELPPPAVDGMAEVASTVDGSTLEVGIAAEYQALISEDADDEEAGVESDVDARDVSAGAVEVERSVLPLSAEGLTQTGGFEMLAVEEGRPVTPDTDAVKSVTQQLHQAAVSPTPDRGQVDEGNRYEERRALGTELLVKASRMFELKYLDAWKKSTSRCDLPDDILLRAAKYQADMKVLRILNDYVASQRSLRGRDCAEPSPATFRAFQSAAEHSPNEVATKSLDTVLETVSDDAIAHAVERIQEDKRPRDLEQPLVAIPDATYHVLPMKLPTDPDTVSFLSLPTPLNLLQRLQLPNCSHNLRSNPPPSPPPKDDMPPEEFQLSFDRAPRSVRGADQDLMAHLEESYHATLVLGMRPGPGESVSERLREYLLGSDGQERQDVIERAWTYGLWTLHDQLRTFDAEDGPLREEHQLRLRRRTWNGRDRASTPGGERRSSMTAVFDRHPAGQPSFWPPWGPKVRVRLIEDVEGLAPGHSLSPEDISKLREVERSTTGGASPTPCPVSTPSPLRNITPIYADMGGEVNKKMQNLVRQAQAVVPRRPSTPVPPEGCTSRRLRTTAELETEEGESPEDPFTDGFADTRSDGLERHDDFFGQDHLTQEPSSDDDDDDESSEEDHSMSIERVPPLDEVLRYADKLKALLQSGDQTTIDAADSLRSGNAGDTVGPIREGSEEHDELYEQDTPTPHPASEEQAASVAGPSHPSSQPSDSASSSSSSSSLSQRSRIRQQGALQFQQDKASWRPTSAYSKASVGRSGMQAVMNWSNREVVASPDREGSLKDAQWPFKAAPSSSLHGQRSDQAYQSDDQTENRVPSSTTSSTGGPGRGNGKTMRRSSVDVIRPPVPKLKPRAEESHSLAANCTPSDGDESSPDEHDAEASRLAAAAARIRAQVAAIDLKYGPEEGL